MRKNIFYKRVTHGILLIILLLVFQATGIQAASNIPTQTREFYVNDFAGILNDDTEQFIIQNSTSLADVSEAQIVVATIESLDGDSIEDYANRMFREYGIGDEDENNGVLLLLSVEDREVRIEVGYGLEGAINDAKAGRIIREIGKPYLSDDNWDDGIKAMYGAILKEVYAEYDLAEPEDVKEMQRVNDVEEKDDVNWSSFIFIIIFLVIVLSNFRNGGGRGRRGGGFYGGFGGGFGGDGFGGGGFGGGGGASGGGGSSGGGGASGGF